MENVVQVNWMRWFCLIGWIGWVSTSNAAFLPPAKGNLGMVSTAQHLATEAGVEVLKQGGNAIDAAVAVGYALAVVYPCCGNLGGGGFMLIHLRNGKNISVNFRERAPAGIRANFFFDQHGKPNKKSLNGYLAVGIPGTVMGLDTALKKYGTFSRQKIMAPAIRLAEKGFVLNKADLAILYTKEDAFRQDPILANLFFKKNQRYVPGDRLRQPALAHTLKAIANKGSDVFYRGWIAARIVAGSKAHGGVMTRDDFKRYRIQISKPLACAYRGYQVLVPPPPSAGLSLCEMFNILKAYPLKQWGFHSAKSVHYMTEAMRYAFADRNALLGDPDFVKNPVARLLSETYAEQVRQKIKPHQAGAAKGVCQGSVKERPQTTHFSVADKWGNAVSVTYTLNGYFGSLMMPAGTGVFLNNDINDFTLKANTPNLFKLIQGKPNLIQPNKQPMSSMTPTLVLKDGQVVMVLGAAGGSTIVTSVLQAIIHRIDYEMDIVQAVNMPRFHMQCLPDVLYHEPYAFSPDTRALLDRMQYQLKLGSIFGTLYWGQMAAIAYDAVSKTWTGSGDNRFPASEALGYSDAKRSGKSAKPTAPRAHS